MLAANAGKISSKVDSSAAMQLFTVRASQSHRSVMYGGSKTEQEKEEEERGLFTGCTCLNFLKYFFNRNLDSDTLF